MDAETFKAEQATAWSSVAPAWSKWWRVIDEAAQDLNELLVDRAGVEPGQRVLDVASGLGEPSLTAARRCGPGGSVTGVDLAPGMISFARERAGQAGLENVGFREGDAEDLPFGDASFDAAVCRWGIMLLGDPGAAVKSIHRCLRPGARFATSVWGPEERSPMLAIARRVVPRELDLPAPDPAAPGPFALQKPGQLLALFEGAGFGDCREETRLVKPVFADAEEYATYIHEMSSSLRSTLAKHPPEAAERVVAAIAAEAREFAGGDGRVELESEVICVSGCR